MGEQPGKKRLRPSLIDTPLQRDLLMPIARRAARFAQLVVQVGTHTHCQKWGTHEWSPAGFSGTKRGAVAVRADPSHMHGGRQKPTLRALIAARAAGLPPINQMHASMQRRVHARTPPHQRCAGLAVRHEGSKAP